MRSLNLIAFATILSVTLGNNIRSLDVVVEWNDLEFGFPSATEREAAIRDGNYVAGNGVPIDVDVDYKDNGSSRIFATVPRFSTGIPFSLGTVCSYRGPNGPLLIPYPSYSWHSSHGDNCDGITSVFRVAIDECKRLWVLDTGRIGDVQHCPPQLLVFNLLNDELIHRYRFPSNQYTPGVSLFITPILDVRDPPPAGKCSKTMVYIADVTNHGLLVYSSAKNRSWRIENKLMHPDPDWGTFTIAGESFDLMDGIFGISLTPRNAPGDRYLFFHALAGESEAAVQLRLVDNENTWIENPSGHERAFRVIGTRGVQCAAQAMDQNGNLYCGLMEPIAIFSWNIGTPYRQNFFKIVANNPKTLQFASAMKIIKNHRGIEELWTSTCRFQKIMAGTKNISEINFRIQGCSVIDLQSGVKPCRLQQQRQLTDRNGAETTNTQALLDSHQNLIFN